jgi:hypothetical protein
MPAGLVFVGSELIKYICSASNNLMNLSTYMQLFQGKLEWNV